MPGETPKTANRWEGTQTYKKPEATKRKARTVAQLREEAAANSRANREKTINARRGSVGDCTPTNARRASLPNAPLAGTPVRDPVARNPTPRTTQVSDPKEEFFDADEMPGSGKKKRQTSGAGEPSKEDMEVDTNQTGPTTAVDPAMLSLLMSIKKDINDTTTTAVSKINDRIDENARAIEKVGDKTTEEIRKLRLHVEDSQAKFEEKMTTQFEARDKDIQRRLLALENKKQVSISSPPGQRSRQLEAYNRARCSLKIWPMSETDLVDSVRVFMKNKLGIDDERIRTFGTFSTKQSIGRGAKERAEVLVQFECREDRDFVKSMGFNLANERESGMAIHVPGHLLDNYYALNSIGYNIKKNQDGVRRAVKFDDTANNIYLDICIGGKWKRIFPDEARTALKSSPGVGDSASGRSIEAEDLVSLVRGDPVPGLTNVVVVDEDSTDPGQ